MFQRYGVSSESVVPNLGVESSRLINAAGPLWLPDLECDNIVGQIMACCVLEYRLILISPDLLVP